jgi:hypothetical protein
MIVIYDLTISSPVGNLTLMDSLLSHTTQDWPSYTIPPDFELIAMVICVLLLIVLARLAFLVGRQRKRGLPMQDMMQAMFAGDLGRRAIARQRRAELRRYGALKTRQHHRRRRKSRQITAFVAA